MNKTPNVSLIVTISVLGLVAFVALLMAVLPQYSVWQQGLAGEAALNRSVQEKQILIEQARAEVESAKLRAEAITIVGAAAKEFPEYRLQEFMGAFADALQNNSIQKMIFVPTEANIPITEASRSVGR